MFDVQYDGLRIEPTLAATRELIKHCCDISDVKEILEEGYDCAASRRKQNIIERCIRKGTKEYKVVIAKAEVTYPDGFRETVWRLIHVGKTAYKCQKLYTSRTGGKSF